MPASDGVIASLENIRAFHEQTIQRLSRPNAYVIEHSPAGPIDRTAESLADAKEQLRRTEAMITLARSL